MFTLLGFYSPSPAKAETLTTYGASDFYFELEAGNTFTVRATAQQYGIDSMFWLYNSNNQLLTANDDYYGLDSYISYDVQESGTYRLRTGVCCGDPERWYGTSYTIDTNSVPSQMPEQPTSTTSTTTTTIAPYLNAPQNLIVTSTNQSKVYLSWDSPEQSNVQVERYAVFFSKDNWASGWAISSIQTSAIVEELEPNTEYQFKVRADNDSIPVYSAWSNEVSGLTLSVPTTTSSTTTTTTLSPSTTEQSTTTTTELTTTTSSTTTSVPVTTVLPVLPTVPSTTTVPQVAETTTTLQIPSTTTIAPQEEPVQGIDAEVASLINAIANLPQSEVQEAVDNIIEEGVSTEEATALATNPDVIQSVTPDQAAEIFDAVEVSELSEEQAEQLVEAVQGASEEVRAEFEDSINVFDNKFNTYVPIGSVINVGQRKALIAATGVLFMAPAVSVSSSTSTSSSNSSRKK